MVKKTIITFRFEIEETNPDLFQDILEGMYGAYQALRLLKGIIHTSFSRQDLKEDTRGI